MRGKVILQNLLKTCFRITPAYAGKSPELLENLICSRDHPRLCGEKPAFTAVSGMLAGSPPPMRGKVRSIISACSNAGITPAYAGKSAPQLGQYWNA